MDLAFLAVMQSFREGAGAFLNSFLNQMTELGDKAVVPVLLALVYWCISKEFGTYLLLGYHWNRLVNGFLKVTACAYRPWIRQPSLIPDADAVKGATGYSFPSGHSMNAATIFGGVAVNKKINKSLRIAGLVIMLLIGFSRLYMCVHTPQDVLVGLILGCIVMYFACRALPHIENSKNGDIITATISIVIAIAIAVYASLKSYPVDYDEAGQILVDGAKMAEDTFKAVGWNLGFFIGWIIERRFVKFSSEGSIQARCLRLFCGLGLYYFFNLSILPLIKNAIGGNVGIIVNCLLQMLFIVLLYPMCVKAVQKKREKI